MTAKEVLRLRQVAVRKEEDDRQRNFLYYEELVKAPRKVFPKDFGRLGVVGNRIRNMFKHVLDKIVKRIKGGNSE